jgi:probable HAF family extracellular repeat protein
MKLWSRIFLDALVTILALSTFAQTPPTCHIASRYKIVPLPLHPVRINSSGAIAGKSESEQLVTWTRDQGFREVNVPARLGSVDPMGLNEKGDIVGQVTATTTNRGRAFSYIQGKFQLLSEAPSQAKAINDSAQIAGEESPGPVLWSGSRDRLLAGCCGGRVFGINNRGEVVGELNDREGHYSAFVWDDERGLRLIAPAGSRSSTALAINNSGQILIQGFSPNQVFLRDHDRLTPVALSPEFASQPLALSDCDVIVGEYGTSSDYYHAFIWDRQNGFRDLNRLVDKAEGWNLESAVDINERGEIIGSGDHESESDAGFLLVPEEPAIAASSTELHPGRDDSHGQ